MYASVRQYRVTDAGAIARRIDEEFLAIIREVPGFSAYYVVDGDDGSLVTVTLADDQAGVEDSANRAANWISENQDVADLIQGSPNVTNGEVRAQG
jgi:hypothetical protein